MRAIHHSDVTAAARVLLGMPVEMRESACARMLREAHWADHFTKRTGRVHQLWGNGSLRAAAYGRRLVPEPAALSAEYCNCLMLVLDHVIARRWSALE